MIFSLHFLIQGTRNRLRYYFFALIYSVPLIRYFLIRKCETTLITPHSLHQHMVRQYCKTNGLLQDKLFRSICYQRRDDLIPFILSEINECLSNGVLYQCHKCVHPFDSGELAALKLDYIENGYANFPFSFYDSFIEKVVENLTSANGFEFTCRTHTNALLNSIKFHERPADVILVQTNLTNVDDKISDLDLAKSFKRIDRLFELLSQYLMDSKLAIKKHTSVWWSFPSQSASSECAQLYHFDCDSLKWIKFFTYLSDVDSSHGPHVAIKRTHIPGNKSQRLLDKGYVRHDDDDILDTLKPGQQEIEYSLKRGSIIIADTRCWHKGSQVQHGQRIMMDHVYLAHQLSRNVV